MNTLSYETVKKLKDAGFPQNAQGLGYFMNVTGNPFVFQSFNENEVYVPTLSELIEACGEEFFELHKPKKGNYKYGIWQAGSINEQGWQWVERGSGATPEEAVANLYLELHK